MPIQALSLYTDKQLIGLSTDQLAESIRLQAALQGIQPPTEVFVIDPHPVGYLLKGEATRAAVNILGITQEYNGDLTADGPVATVTSRFLRPADPDAFNAIRDAGLARFAEAQISVPAGNKLIVKRDAYLALAGGDVAKAQAFWALGESKPWPP
jgi:hypothetical protein